MKRYLLLIITISSVTFTNCSSLFDKEESEYQDCTGNVVDGRGRYTKTKIKDQCWIKEDVEYKVDISGKWTPYIGDTGKLFYSLSAVDNKAICPLGYQIPSVQEWQELGQQAYLLDNNKKGYLVEKIESFLYKNTVTRRLTITMVGEGVSSYWLVRGNKDKLASFSNIRGLTLQDMPSFIHDVRELPEKSTVENGYFSIKCIRIENL